MQEKRVARVQQLEQEKEAIALEKAAAEQREQQALAENAQLKALIAQLKSHQ